MTKLQRAVEAIQAGEIEQGRELLGRILRRDPNNAEAWLWLSRLVDSEAERL